MKKLPAAIAIVLAGLIVLTLSAQDTATRESPAVVVGTFDSRGVLFAYVASKEFREYLSAQKKDVSSALDRARAAGDDQLVAALDALGPAMQKRIHEQGFGTAPVDDIIARIAEKLPRIAEDAGVDIIVSKWALTYSGPAARFVDVTDRIAAELGADEATMKGIRELRRNAPVPLDELE